MDFFFLILIYEFMKNAHVGIHIDFCYGMGCLNGLVKHAIWYNLLTWNVLGTSLQQSRQDSFSYDSFTSISFSSACL